MKELGRLQSLPANFEENSVFSAIGSYEHQLDVTSRRGGDRLGSEMKVQSVGTLIRDSNRNQVKSYIAPDVAEDVLYEAP